MNYNEQLRKLYQQRSDVKLSNEHYFELQTENGIISIPRKVVIKALNSSIEHFKSRIQYQESLKEESK
jgi:hypothetical protein